MQYARELEGVDPERLALWGMSLGGGLALMTAAADPRIAATITLVPMADGLAAVAQPAPPGVTARLTWSIMRRAVTRKPVTIPIAGAPGSFALIAAPEALPGFERLASANGWRNEVNAAGLLIPFIRFRPVRSAARIQGPVLVQLGEQDGMVPLPAIEKASARAPKGELVRYPIDHFGASGLSTSDTSPATSSSFFTNTCLPQRRITPRPAPALTTPTERATARPSRTHHHGRDNADVREPRSQSVGQRTPCTSPTDDRHCFRSTKCISGIARRCAAQRGYANCRFAGAITEAGIALPQRARLLLVVRCGSVLSVEACGSAT